jgi:hypothetical protein
MHARDYRVGRCLVLPSTLSFSELFVTVRIRLSAACTYISPWPLALSTLIWLKNDNMTERATKRRTWVPRQDDSGYHVGRCHCLGRLGMMAMAAVWYADLGRCGLLSAT